MTKKYRYIYDKRTGHFIKKLNEDDTSATSTNNAADATNTLNTDTANNTNNTNTQNSSSNTSGHKSVESDATIQALMAKKTDIDKKFETNLSTLQKLLDDAKKKASTSAALKVYDPVETDETVLTIQKKINELTKLHAIDLYNIEDKRLVLLKALGNANESYYKVPEKYGELNESNLHTAKIYMKDLVVPDDDHILKGMVDFKRAFKDTNLLYGKDKDGYFVVAIDNDDFDTLTNTLTEVGYLRDEIIDTIVPLVLDRKSMIQ